MHHCFRTGFRGCEKVPGLPQCPHVLACSLVGSISSFPPMSAVEGIKLVRSVCLSVSERSNGWTVEVGSQNSVWGLWLLISRTSLVAKVIGQRSRSLDWKTWFSKFQIGWPVHIHLSWHNHVMWCYCVTSWHHVFLAVLVENDSIKWQLGGLWGRNTDKESTTREGRQRSGIFIVHVVVEPVMYRHHTHRHHVAWKTRPPSW